MLISTRSSLNVEIEILFYLTNFFFYLFFFILAYAPNNVKIWEEKRAAMFSGKGGH